jgi:hypothetical protein
MTSLWELPNATRNGQLGEAIGGRAARGIYAGEQPSSGNVPLTVQALVDDLRL